MQVLPSRSHSTYLSLALAVALSLSGCGGGGNEKAKNTDADPSDAAAASTATAPVDAEPAENAPAVDSRAALLSGAPPIEVEIDGKKWVTSKPGPSGDPRAKKGGSLKTSINGWPATLRTVGIASNTYLNSIVEGMCYESLCGMHSVTLDTTPKLATHWHISEDKMTFRFRINPKARWADGKPVTADDVIATYRLSQDDGLVDPMWKQIMGKLHEPNKLSDLEIEVKCRVKDWRNFISFSQMSILPAHELNKVTGEEYLKKYNFSYPVGTGPYKVQPKDIKKSQSITLTRRDDYWAKDEAANVGLNNFDRVHFIVIREQRLALQKAMKGDLDFYPVYTAKWWVEDLDPSESRAIARGLLVRQKVFTKNPVGVQGMAANMRDPILADVRVRKALSHLYDRRTLITEFAFDEYIPSKSYFPNSDAENPSNAMAEYDPNLAGKLLADAGWKTRDTDGYLTKDGKRLSLSLLYRSQGFEKYLTVFQSACKRAGIEIELKLVTPETHWKNMMDRKFQLAGMAWGAILFPYPKSNWSSEMAHKKGSNNITGVSSDKIDAIIEKYDAEFDLEKRNALLRELDGELYSLIPYVLEWYSPAERLLYWNRFGMPDHVLSRYADWREVFSTWWVSPKKDRQLRQAKNNPSKSMPIPPAKVDAWSDASPAADLAEAP